MQTDIEKIKAGLQFATSEVGTGRWEARYEPADRSALAFPPVEYAARSDSEESAIANLLTHLVLNHPALLASELGRP